MSELDEYGIVRYIIDTGDKVASVIINDIAEDVGGEFLMGVRKDRLPIFEELWEDDPKQVVEYILVKGVKFYVSTWISVNYIVFQVDLYTTESGRILYLDNQVKNQIYDVEWLLQNKNLFGFDGGFIKRNYRVFKKCFINDYGVKVLFDIDHSKIDDFYGFEKCLARTFYDRIEASQKKHSV